MQYERGTGSHALVRRIDSDTQPMDDCRNRNDCSDAGELGGNSRGRRGWGVAWMRCQRHGMLSMNRKPTVVFLCSFCTLFIDPILPLHDDVNVADYVITLVFYCL